MKKKKTEASEGIALPPIEIVQVVEAKVLKVSLLTQEFGNGDMNTLRDKINEIIRNA